MNAILKGERRSLGRMDRRESHSSDMAGHGGREGETERGGETDKNTAIMAGKCPHRVIVRPRPRPALSLLPGPHLTGSRNRCGFYAG